MEASTRTEEIETYLAGLLGSLSIHQPAQGSEAKLNSIVTPGQEDEPYEIKRKAFVDGARALARSVRKQSWSQSDFKLLVKCLIQRYLGGKDATYRRALVPTFRALHAVDAKTTVREMGEAILSHLAATTDDNHLLEDGAQLISQMLDFEVGREVIRANLQHVAQWNTQYLTICHRQAPQSLDVLFGFRNLAILRAQFPGPATKISDEMEELAVASLTRVGYPLEAVSLIALAVATSVASRETSYREKNERAAVILRDVQHRSEYAYLCLCGALLSTLDWQTLIVEPEGLPSLLRLMFESGVSILETTNSTACRIQGLQALTAWMLKTAQALTSEYQGMALLEAEETVGKFDRLLSLVWTYWDDTNDSVGVGVSELFNGLLKFYQAATDDTRFEALLDKLVGDVMRFDWHRKVRYSILASLIPHLGCQALLAARPTLIEELLRAYQSSALATRVTDCLSQIFAQHSPDEVWVAPLGRSLSSADPNIRKQVSTFLLPKLARVDPHLMLRLVAWLQGPVAKGRRCQHGAIAATKVAIASGALLRKDDLEKMWPCLFHTDLTVRIDMLGLASASRKLTSVVTPAELDAVRQALPLSAHCASPEFRQKFNSHLLKLLGRLHASQAALLRLPMPSPVVQASIVRHTKFLGWVEQVAFASLYPGASYPRVSSGLKLLEALSQVVGWSPRADLLHQLAHVLTSPYDSCRLLASALLTSLPSIPSLKSKALVGWAMAALASPRAKECASGAAALDYIFRAFVIKQGIHISLGTPAPHPLPPAPAFAQELLTSLHRALDAATSNLSEAASASPTHGLFLALQRVLGTLERGAPHVEQSLDFWKDYVQLCLEAVSRMLSLGRTALLSASPDEALLSLAGELPRHALESVLSYCWRGVKEAAETQEVLLTRLHADLAPLGAAVAAGGALFSLLVELRHRGAFSALMPCFRGICARLLGSPASDTVVVWLDLLLGKLVKADASITQRSAGLPLGIIAILDALPPGHALLTSTARRLFWLARFGRLPPETPHAASDADNPFGAWQPETFCDGGYAEVACEDALLPRVHGLNVLRAVFQDAGVGPQAFERFGQLGLSLAAAGLGSASWAVRNSSVLLFSTLLIRVFGIKRVRDEHDSRNRLTLREFFARFPALGPFLLQSPRAAPGSPNAPALFPALALLARLHPTPDDHSERQASLVAGVEACAASPLCKVRELAAKAMVSLTHPAQRSATLARLLTLVAEERSPNKSHGLLLMVLELTRAVLAEATSTVGPDVTAIAQIFGRNLDRLLHRTRLCTYRRGVALRIGAALASPAAEPLSPRGVLFTRLKHLLEVETLGFYEKLPLVELYQGSRWLDDPDYEVRERALVHLSNSLSTLDSPTKSELHAKVVDLVLQPDPHLGTLILALGCLSKQMPPFPFEVLGKRPVGRLTSLPEVARRIYALATAHYSVGVRAASIPLLAATLAQGTASDLCTLAPTVLDAVRLMSELSHPATDLTLREAVGLASFYLAPWLQSPPALPDPTLEEVVASLFTTLVHLLQDDDAEIRQQVAYGLHAAGVMEDELSPERGLELLFQRLVEFGPGERSVATLLAFLVPETPFGDGLLTAQAQRRDVFEAEAPNCYAEPLIACQLAFRSLALLTRQPTTLPTVQAQVPALVGRATRDLEELMAWAVATPPSQQVLLGGPLGIFGVEFAFRGAYQNLTMLRLGLLASPPPSERWGWRPTIHTTLRTFAALAEDPSLPVHPLLLDLTCTPPPSASSPRTTFGLEFAAGFLTSYSS
ncbi:hypothetical protein L0F63_000711 [Massospora cicadina]|nr:hypothetical protein L0F63_000711 [Massospora cicadina]